MSARHYAAIALMVLACAAAGSSAAQQAARPAQPATRPAAATPAAATPPAAPTRPPPVRGEGVAAIVNDQVISTFDVNQRTLLIIVTSGIQQPSEDVVRQVRDTALRQLIDERLQMQEAKRTETRIDPRQIDDALQNFAQGNRTTVDVVTRQLAAGGVGMVTLRQRFEANLAWNRTVGRVYGSRVRISETQVNETIERLSEYAAKTQYDVMAILIPVDRPQDQEDAKRGAESLVDAIKKGAQFQQVAKQFSALPSSAAGGELGWLAEGEISPAEIKPIVTQMQPGALAGPIQANAGYYILALRDKRQGATVQHKVTLRQISGAIAQRSLVDTVRRKVRGCPSVDAAVAGQTGIEVTDLGEVEENELADEMKAEVVTTIVGAASNVFESGGKARSLVVCARSNSGGAVPTRQEVESQLENAEYEMLAERHLRKLRRDATIISR